LRTLWPLDLVRQQHLSYGNLQLRVLVLVPMYGNKAEAVPGLLRNLFHLYLRLGRLPQVLLHRALRVLLRPQEGKVPHSYLHQLRMLNQLAFVALGAVVGYAALWSP
jgi:hypothetical protein